MYARAILALVLLVGCGASGDRPPPFEFDREGVGLDPIATTSVPWDAPCQAQLPNGFCFISSNTDSVGAGRRISISGAAGKITAQGSGSLEVAAEQASLGSWKLGFAPAEGQYFVPGVYQPVERYPVADFGAAGLSVSDEYRACADLSGRFEVTELETDRVGDIVRFAASFTQQCQADVGMLRGAVNYNATGTRDPTPEEPGDCEVSMPTGFCIASQAGHPDGLGRRLSLTPEEAWIGVELVASSLNVTVVGASEWRMSFNAPAGLSVGRFEDARGGSMRLPGKPFIAGLCSSLRGSFEVLNLELEEDAAGRQLVHAADIDFSYQCGSGKAPRLDGKLRFRR